MGLKDSDFSRTNEIAALFGICLGSVLQMYIFSRSILQYVNGDAITEKLVLITTHNDSLNESKL